MKFTFISNAFIKKSCTLKIRVPEITNGKLIPLIAFVWLQGQMELQETVKMWKQKGHLMTYWKETYEPKPTDFLSKFVSGSE